MRLTDFNCGPGLKLSGHQIIKKHSKMHSKQGQLADLGWAQIEPIELRT